MCRLYFKRIASYLFIISPTTLLSVIALIISLLIPQISFSKSPEDARNELAQKGLSFKESIFIQRAEMGDEQAVRLFLDAGMDPNTNSWFIGSGGAGYGMTPLMAASMNGKTGIVKILLDRGADVNAKNQWGETALIFAARGGHTELAKTLLDRGADINAQGWDLDKRKMDTALIAAGRAGHAEIVRLLLTKGAAAEDQMWTGKTALAIATEKGHSHIVKILLEHGANPNIRECIGSFGCKTLLQKAAPYPEQVSAIVK